MASETTVTFPPQAKTRLCCHVVVKAVGFGQNSDTGLGFIRAIGHIRFACQDTDGGKLQQPYQHTVRKFQSLSSHLLKVMSV